MKSLGVVRKLDELGRIVIPKEVRNSQGWESGTPMEMFMQGECLVVKKHISVLSNQGQILKELEALTYTTPTPHAKESIQKAIDYIKQK